MSLTSEQARAIAARPRISPLEEQQMISLFADGKKPEEVQAQFPEFAVGTIKNLKTRKKEQIAEVSRARTVQFSDIPGVRKQSRLNDSWELRTVGRMLIQKHLESCFATDPVTGERKFVEQLVDNRKVKDYADMILKANKTIMIETGQQVRLDGRWVEQVLGLDGHNGVDYPAIVAGTPAREAREKYDQLEQMRRDIIDHDWRMEHSADVMQAKGYIETPEERGEWLQGPALGFWSGSLVVTGAAVTLLSRGVSPLVMTRYAVRSRLPATNTKVFKFPSLPDG